MPTRPTRFVLSSLIVVALAACGPTVTSLPPATTAPSSDATATDEAPTSSTAATTSPQASVGQTDTAWGRIWDDAPGWFPQFPGSAPADDASPEPASARYVVTDGDPQEMASWLQTALETATYSTEALSGPLEDGSFVLDSVGDGECRIETRSPRSAG